MRRKTIHLVGIEESAQEEEAEPTPAVDDSPRSMRLDARSKSVNYSAGNASGRLGGIMQRKASVAPAGMAPAEADALAGPFGSRRNSFRGDADGAPPDRGRRNSLGSGDQLGRGRRVSMQAAQGAEGAKVSDVAEGSLSKRMQETQDTLKRTNDSALDRIRSSLRPFETTFGKVVISELLSKVEDEFEMINRSHDQTVKDFSDSQASASKQAIRAQAEKYELKLETARTAAQMRLKNQAVEMEALASKKLEETMTSLSSTGAGEVFEARRKQEELSKMVHFQTQRANKTEDLLKATQTKLDRAEHRAGLVEKDYDALQADADETRRLLADTLSSLNVKTDENKSLSDQLKSVLESMTKSKSGSSADVLLRQREEAVAEAKKAKEAAAKFEEEAARQKQRADETGMNVQVQVRQTRARAALEEEVMRRSFGELEDALEREVTSHTVLADELRQVKTELVDLQEIGESGGDLFSTKKQVKQLERELAELRGTLSHAQQDLHVTVDKNKSLSQQIKDLVSTYHETKASSEALEATASELNQKLAEQEEQLNSAAAGRETHLQEQLSKALQRLEERGFSVSDVQLSRWSRMLTAMIASHRAMATSIETALDDSQPDPSQPGHGEAPAPSGDDAAQAQEEGGGEDALEAIETLLGSLQGGDSHLFSHLDKLLDRLGKTAASLERMTRDASHIQAALENANFEVDQVKDRAESRVRKIKEQSSEERAVLIRSALGALRQLRTHLTYTLSGLQLSFPSDQINKEGFAWKQKRSRWGVVSNTGEGMVVQLNKPISQLKQHMQNLIHAEKYPPLIGSTTSVPSAISQLGRQVAYTPSPPTRATRPMTASPRSSSVVGGNSTPERRPRTAGNGFDITSVWVDGDTTVQDEVTTPISSRPSSARPTLARGQSFTPAKATVSQNVDQSWLAAVLTQNSELLAKETPPPRQRVRTAHGPQVTTLQPEMPRAYISSLTGVGAPDA